MTKIIPTEGDWGWFAGLIDGDGCISIGCVKNRYYSASIIVVNKKPENVLKLMRIFGGSLGRTSRRGASSYVNGLYYRWVLKSTDEVMGCLQNCLPHLAEKRSKALLAIELCEIQKGQRALRTYKNREVSRAKMDLIYQAALGALGSGEERPVHGNMGQAIEKQ